MTTSPSSHAQPLESAGDLIAAVPAFLGFVPERSVVLLVHDEVTGRIGATARTDLGLTRAGTLRVDCRRHIGHAMDLLRRQGADRMYCLLIDDRSLTTAMPAIVECLETNLQGDDGPDGEIVLADLYLAHAIAAGERWLCRHGRAARSRIRRVRRRRWPPRWMADRCGPRGVSSSLSSRRRGGDRHRRVPRRGAGGGRR